MIFAALFDEERPVRTQMAMLEDILRSLQQLVDAVVEVFLEKYELYTVLFDSAIQILQIHIDLAEKLVYANASYFVSCPSCLHSLPEC